MKKIIFTILLIVVCSKSTYAQSESLKECMYPVDCKSNEVCFFGECKIENMELKEYVKDNYTEEALNYCKNNVPERCYDTEIGNMSFVTECDNIFFNDCKAGLRCKKGKCEPKDKDDTSLNRAEILEMAREKQENEESLNFQEMYVLKQEEKAQELFLEGSKKIFSDKVNDILFKVIEQTTGRFSEDDLNSLKKYIDQYLQELNEKFSYELQQEGIKFLYEEMESWKDKINNDTYFTDVQKYVEDENLQNISPQPVHVLPKTGFPSILKQISNFLLEFFR